MNPRLIQGLTAMFALAAGTVSASDPYFRSCDQALETPPFKRLQEFYMAYPEQPSPDACFRLNKSEFLVTVTNTGRVGQGLYHFNADTGSYEFADGAYRESIQVKREFEGYKNKRFVILHTSNLHAGNWVTGYEILSLQPRVDNRSFRIQQLLFAMQDPVEGMCGSSLKEGTATNVKDFRVEKEGTAAATLVFDINSQVCPDGAKRSYERRFVWQSGEFREAR